jgi:hypothetical protein
MLGSPKMVCYLSMFVKSTPANQVKAIARK